MSAQPLLRRRDRPRLARGEVVFRSIDGDLWQGGPGPSDARQGNIGDCYLLSALSAVARSSPEKLEEMIRPVGRRRYRVTFRRRLEHGGTKPETVVVDDAIPVSARDRAPIYARTLPDVRGRVETWPLLVEKAYAAWKGGYHVVGEGGMVEDTLEEITGEPTRMIYTLSHHPEMLWSALKRATCERWPATVCTWGRTVRPGLDELGFHPNHILIFLGVHEWSGRRIVWLRDPYDDPPSGSLVLPDPHGVFTLSWDDFVAYFAEIHLNASAAFELQADDRGVTIGRALDRSYAFEPVPEGERRRLARAFDRVSLEANATVFAQGDAADGFYVVQSGSAEAFVRRSGRGQDRVAVLRPGEAFGELAVLDRAPRGATVKTFEPSVLYRLSPSAFDRLLRAFPEVEARLRRRFELQRRMQTWSQGQLPSVSLDALLRAGVERSVARGTLILRQGEESDRFYVLARGRVEVLVREGPRRRRLAVVEEGAVFGEAAALSHEPRTASVRALTNCELIEIDVSEAAKVVDDFRVLRRQLEFVARRRARRRVGYSRKHD